MSFDLPRVATDAHNYKADRGAAEAGYAASPDCPGSIGAAPRGRRRFGRNRQPGRVRLGCSDAANFSVWA